MEHLVWHLKTISSLQQFKTSFNACCSLVLVCKDIIPKYGKTRTKGFFPTVGTFSLTKSTLFKNFLKHLSIKFLGNHSFEISPSGKLNQYRIVSHLSKCENIYKLKYILYQIYKLKIKTFKVTKHITKIRFVDKLWCKFALFAYNFNVKKG